MYDAQHLFPWADSFSGVHLYWDGGGIFLLLRIRKSADPRFVELEASFRVPDPDSQYDMWRVFSPTSPSTMVVPCRSTRKLEAQLVFICFMPETKGRSLESVDIVFKTSPLREDVVMSTTREDVDIVHCSGGR